MKIKIAQTVLAHILVIKIPHTGIFITQTPECHPAESGFFRKPHRIECGCGISELHFMRRAIISVVSKMKVIGVVIKYNFAIITARQWSGLPDN